jgi:flagella basal body P-ring formation protein FlgA
MKSLLGIIFIIVSLLSINLYAKQYSVARFSADILVNDIKKQLLAQMGDVVNPEVTVELSNAMIFDSIPKDVFYIFVDLAKPTTLLGKIILDTSFIGEDNTIISSQKCLLESEVFATVYVTNRKLNSKDVISNGDIKKKRIKLTSRSEDYIFDKEKIVGKQARRSMMAGVAFSDRWIEIVPDIKKGQMAMLLIKSNGFEIKSNVTALDSGRIGDMIRLKTNTKKILRGKIIDKTHILISSN